MHLVFFTVNSRFQIEEHRSKVVLFFHTFLCLRQFSGVTVYTPTYILNQSEVIMMFDSGAGVEVVENEGYMTARVYLPWTFIVRIFQITQTFT